MMKIFVNINVQFVAYHPSTIHFSEKVAESQGPVCPSYHLRTFSELGQLGLLFLPNNINMRLALRKNH